MLHLKQTTGRAGNLKASLLAGVQTRFFDGEPGAGAINAEDPAVKALIDAAVESATSGLKANNASILGEKKALQTQFTDFTKQWEGLDSAAVRGLVARFQNDEEGKLISEGKIDEVIQRRVSAMQKDFETKHTAATTRVSELEGDLSKRSQRVRDLLLDSSVRQAASKLGVLPTALDDAVIRATQVFALDEHDNLVARDSAGALLMGKNGKDSLSAGEWLEQMKEKAPHWFSPPTGAGAGGGAGRGGAGKVAVISREDARNPQLYRAAKEAAGKAGQELQIVSN